VGTWRVPPNRRATRGPDPSPRPHRGAALVSGQDPRTSHATSEAIATGLAQAEACDRHVVGATEPSGDPGAGPLAAAAPRCGVGERTGPSGQSIDLAGTCTRPSRAKARGAHVTRMPSNREATRGSRSVAATPPRRGGGSRLDPGTVGTTAEAIPRAGHRPEPAVGTWKAPPNRRATRRSRPPAAVEPKLDVGWRSVAGASRATRTASPLAWHGPRPVIRDGVRRRTVGRLAGARWRPRSNRSPTLAAGRCRESVAEPHRRCRGPRVGRSPRAAPGRVRRTVGRKRVQAGWLEPRRSAVGRTRWTCDRFTTSALDGPWSVRAEAPGGRGGVQCEPAWTALHGVAGTWRTRTRRPARCGPCAGVRDARGGQPPHPSRALGGPPAEAGVTLSDHVQLAPLRSGPKPVARGHRAVRHVRGAARLQGLAPLESSLLPVGGLDQLEPGALLGFQPLQGSPLHRLGSMLPTTLLSQAWRKG